ncbi:S-adenosyl-L-methionine-dependent methyltransferase [Xylariomycetidae sp. FL0641]|nr:S-adenosyl-L-methionine-dependent methyltransferase [Xylariomycetidae sp. FL0641]
MATFARATYSAKNYAAFRPTYPTGLYQTVLKYCRPRPNARLLDIGCGHGIAAQGLAWRFTSIDAIDPSVSMIEQARERAQSPDSKSSKITFRQGRAEDLSFLDTGSVDLAVAGQAAHWFDWTKAWPELARVVRPGGAVAFWGYKDPVLVRAEAATAVMERFVYGTGEVAPGLEAMGPYWEQPGRNILRDMLRSVHPPPEDWMDVVRPEHEPGALVDPPKSYWLRKKMALGRFESYVRTYSAYRAWKDAHPEIKSRADGGTGDVMDVMWDRMVDVVPEWREMGDSWRQATVQSDWGTFLVMARRRD